MTSKYISIYHNTFSLSRHLTLRASATANNKRKGKPKETWTPTPQQATTLLLTSAFTFLIWALLTKIIPEKYSPIVLLGLIGLFLFFTKYGFHYLPTSESRKSSEGKP